MELGVVLQDQVVRSAELAGHTLVRARLQASSWLGTLRAYRRAYFMSRDFRRLAG